MAGIFRVAVEAIIVRDEDKKVLVMHRVADRDHAAGEWETLTGRVEKGETFEEGLNREVMEETGLEVEIVQPVNTFHFYRGKEKVEHLGVTFWCRYKEGEVKIDPHEHSECRWVSIDDAIELVDAEGIKEGLRRMKEMMNNFF